MRGEEVGRASLLLGRASLLVGRASPPVRRASLPVGRATLQLVGRASLPAYQSATELANQSDGLPRELPRVPSRPSAVVYNVTSDHRNRSVAQISPVCQSAFGGNPNFH